MADDYVRLKHYVRGGKNLVESSAEEALFTLQSPVAPRIGVPDIRFLHVTSVQLSSGRVMLPSLPSQVAEAMHYKTMSTYNS